MAGNAPFGTDSTPEVVVKIIGSKLVKSFVEKPRRNKAVCIETQSLVSPPALSPPLHSNKAVTDEAPPDKPSTPQGNMEMRQPGESAEQTPAELPSEHLDVHCVTAPTGDQTLSYIHCQKKPSQRSLFTTASPFSSGAQQVNYKELVGFLLRAVQTGRLDARDEKGSNSLKQSQVKEALTSGTNTAGKRGLNLEKLHQNFHQADFKTTGQLLPHTTEDDGSPALGAQIQRFSKSTGMARQTVYTQESETWLERFSQLERAMRMCDHRNTGTLEKGEAKRLIHNYNQIFNLNLSPLRTEQALHTFETHGEVTLDSVLQHLKEL
ncbi:uncharacterized protein C1orf87 isoform X3 [Polyodon spathula]|uniref:uncharacterized protein C1orf87 isoform X3 n=1 Tax=Polyodon spathula TaxID=7913 RepID=UPI001B7E850C|nr:uncharacterized protein C1orf87 isoform X3 [Polyodon spathula]